MLSQTTPLSSSTTAPMSSSDNFLTFIFTSSILLTLPTPLHRVLSGNWSTCFRSMFLLIRSRFSSTHTIDSRSIPSTTASFYPSLFTTPHIDVFFSMHATAALSWHITGYLALVSSKRWGLRIHRRMGYIAITFFFIHMTVSILTLYHDFVRHHPLSKALLLQLVIRCFRFLFASLAAVRTGNLKRHEELMIRLYIYSSEGAGQIRLSHILLAYFGIDVPACQAENDGYATLCKTSYVIRLVGARAISVLILFLYAVVKKDGRMRKHLRHEIIYLLAFSFICVTLALASDETAKSVMKYGGTAVIIFLAAFAPFAGVQQLPALHKSASAMMSTAFWENLFFPLGCSLLSQTRKFSKQRKKKDISSKAKYRSH